MKDFIGSGKKPMQEQMTIEQMDYAIAQAVNYDCMYDYLQDVQKTSIKLLKANNSLFKILNINFSLISLVLGCGTSILIQSIINKNLPILLFSFLYMMSIFNVGKRLLSILLDDKLRCVLLRKKVLEVETMQYEKMLNVCIELNNNLEVANNYIKKEYNRNALILLGYVILWCLTCYFI